MPSPKKASKSPLAAAPAQRFTKRQLAKREQLHMFFYPLVALVLLVWTVYRAVFSFPVWFDESIGKAIFFGFPVFMYVAVSGFSDIAQSLRPGNFRVGLFRGLAFGGVFGFAAAIAVISSQNRTVLAAPLFSAGSFWREFGLAVLTGFWESLFFYGFIMSVVISLKPHWTMLRHVFFAGALFALFHIPNIILQYQGAGSILGYIFLVFAFGLGQAFLFARERNLYTLMVVHAIWGMTLLIHTL